MTRPGLILRVFAFLAVALAAGETPANEGRYKVIVHPDNPVQRVGRDFLRDVWLKKGNDWDGGGAVHPIDLPAGFAARDQFTRDVIRKTPAQLRSYWNQQIFSGKGVPPREAKGTGELIAYVLAHSGAVGYLPADVDPGGAKVIEVD